MSQIEIIERLYNEADMLLSVGPTTLDINSIDEIAKDIDDFHNDIALQKFTITKMGANCAIRMVNPDGTPASDGSCIFYRTGTKTIIFATSEKNRDHTMTEIRRILRLMVIQKEFIMNLRKEYMNTTLMHKRISVIYGVAQLLGMDVSKAKLETAFKNYTSVMDLGENALYMTVVCHMAAVSIIMKRDKKTKEDIEVFAKDLKEAYGIEDESYMKILTEILEDRVTDEFFDSIAEQVYLALFHKAADTAMLIVTYRFLCAYA